MKQRSGFTLIELLVVVAIFGILASLILFSTAKVKSGVYFTQAKAEFRAFEQAMLMYLLDFDIYPPDVNRNIPAGLEVYLTGGEWPDGPWPGSVYDWDNVTGGDPYIQLSIRFCDIGGGNCRFPDEPWAVDFDSSSSVYHCFSGTCRSHPARPINHPGYCINC